MAFGLRAAAIANRDMRDGAVREAHDVDISPSTKSPASGAVNAVDEITRRDVHTASSIHAQRRLSKAGAKETNLAHQAALRRTSVKNNEVVTGKAPKSSSAANSKPVLVRAQPSKADMRKKPEPRIDTGSPRLPSLESFSIQDILTSIGPEADASIDAIAEICGRSRMSLAEEHSSHRPPYVQHMQAGSSPAESLPSMRLEPVVEVTSSGPHTRSKSKSLALANASRTGDIVSGDATAAMSNVTSHAQSTLLAQRSNEGSSESLPAPLLSHVFAWLRRSSANGEASNVSNQDPRAARILKSILSEDGSIRS